MEYFDLNFCGLSRRLPLTYISASKRVANFSILGDVEFTEKAGEELEKILREKRIIPDCFVGPGINITPFVHHMAKRFRQNRYVILRKSIRGYMTNPEVQVPWTKAPKHVKKIVLNGVDREFLKGKHIVLVDNVISTGTTMNLCEKLMEKIGAKVLVKCAIFLQGDQYARSDCIVLAKLPILDLLIHDERLR